MLAEILESVGVPKQFWLRLLGCSSRQLNEWLAGQRQVPVSVADRLSRAIGVPVPVLLDSKKLQPDRVEYEVLPPLWLKARQQLQQSSEYEVIAGTRLLAAHYADILDLMETVHSDANHLLSAIQLAIDPQAPARKQGKDAAAVFLKLTTLDQGGRGIGEAFRGFLRANGLLVLETPINSDRLEGFCVPVSKTDGVTPCLVANSYQTDWFRRNYVLLHELGHAIFDLASESAVFDVDHTQDPSTVSVDKKIAEGRADAFALHALVSDKLLRAFENRGQSLNKVGPAEFALFVANMHADKRTIVRAAVEGKLITDDRAEQLLSMDIARDLKQISYHALGLANVSEKDIIYPEILRWKDRLTTFPLEGLRLPIPFVRLVLQALKENKINPGKAAELLMVTVDDLAHTYGVDLRQEEELVS